MDVEDLIINRLRLALERLNLAPSYRDMLFSVGKKYLQAQLTHYKTCEPPVYLPLLCCEANGADPQAAVGVTSAWFLLQAAAHLLDKVEDHELEAAGISGNEEGVYTNLSTGMIFVAEWILNHLELDALDTGTAWDVQRAFQETVLSVCSGQHLDLSILHPDLSTCWKIAEAKSGSAFALACYVGTRASTNQTDRLHHFEDFGRYLGTVVQISDDLKDLEDISLSDGKLNSPLVNAYLLHVGGYSSNVAAQHLDDDSTRSSIQQSLVLYLRLEAMKYAEMARNELENIQLSQKPLDQLLSTLSHLSCLGAFAN